MLTEGFMEDMRNRLDRIEQHGVEGKVAQTELATSFRNHEKQNEKEFKHVDDCIHRTDEASVKRDEEILKCVREMQSQLDEIKKLVWKASGALLVIVPVVNYISKIILP